MDIGSLAGIVAGIVLVLASILMGSDLMTFVNVPSLLVVVGGTFAATAIAFPLKELKGAASVLGRVFKNPRHEVVELVKFLLDCRKEAAKDGLLALEKMAGNAPHDSVAKGLRLVADGTDAGTLQQILDTEQRTIVEHHKVGAKIFNEMGKFAPAFGMIGTLVGLVQMLATLDDPSTIGPKMAVALLTTFYGALLANLLFLPMVTKLERRLKDETANMDLAAVGMMSINREESMMVLREKFKAFLAKHGGDVDSIVGG